MLGSRYATTFLWLIQQLVRGKDGGFDPFRPTPKSVLKPSNEPELLPLGPTQNKLPKKGAILNTTPDLRQHRAYYWTAEDVNLWMHQLALRYNYYDLLIEDGVDGETLIDELKTEEVCAPFFHVNDLSARIGLSLD